MLKFKFLIVIVFLALFLAAYVVVDVVPTAAYYYNSLVGSSSNKTTIKSNIYTNSAPPVALPTTTTTSSSEAEDENDEDTLPQRTKMTTVVSSVSLGSAKVVVTSTTKENTDSEATATKMYNSTSPLYCTCFNNRAPSQQRCCQRRMFVEHKMGVVLTRKMWNNYNQTVRMGKVMLPLSSKTDYRQIVLVRNFYDSIVSGYLYHLSGRECWLNPHGVPYNHSVDPKSIIGGGIGHHQNWGTSFHMDFKGYPPKNNRNLCQYLVDESQEAGMWAYMTVAMRGFYKSLYPMYERYLSRPNQTLFVCYDDLLANDGNHKRIPTLNKMHRFLFPGDPNGQYRGPPKPTTRKLKRLLLLNSSYSYSGGHSTSKNTTLRKELQDLIRRLDEEKFHNMIATKQKDIVAPVCDD